MKYLASLLFILIFFSACKNPQAETADAGNGHDHGAVMILEIEEGLELFAEVGQLYAGHGVDIRAFLTFIEDYTPAEMGMLYTRLVQGNDVPDWEPLEMEHHGIFTGSLIPGEGGTCDFEFMYEEDDISVVFVEKSMKVYTHDDPAPEDVHEHGDLAIFTKEQAWRTEFGLMPVEKADFAGQIHCSGEVIITPSSQLDIIAPASGKVAFISGEIIEGKYIRKGEALFTILGTGLSHDNILLELNTARTEFDKSKANLDRKAKLLELEAVSKSSYEDARAVYLQDKARLEVLQSQVSEAGMSIRSPISGFISKIMVTDHAYASTGTALVSMLKLDGVMIKANVPALHAGKITSISDANIKFPGNPDVIPLDSLDGKLSSFGHSVEEGTGMIPVYISLGRSDFIAGTFVEIWLSIGKSSEHILVPESSLLEEYGRYYVYVQAEGEAYEKRQIVLGETDGINHQVMSGLKPGEVIVSRGGMAIRVANTMGAAPVHQH